MNNIKKFRVELHMQLKDLAKKTGYSVGYLCHLENGSRKNPSIKAMEIISVALQHTIPEIFFPSENNVEK